MSEVSINLPLQDAGQTYCSVSDPSFFVGQSKIKIVELSPEFEVELSALIEKNLWKFAAQDSAYISSYRRLKSLLDFSHQDGAKVLCAILDEKVVGGAGLGAFHNLPITDGIGEIRDLVVEESYRSKGIGKLLLQRCIHYAHQIGYRRVYLETTPDMTHAQQLFLRYGFKAVRQKLNTNVDASSASPSENFQTNKESEVSQDLKCNVHSGETNLPCYYILELHSSLPQAAT
ncbi:MAG: GNAT family N-acetyltransferase [Oligoflexales bacterium]|nr:GNAT family N-acetyltransferase [Oligoflexales bacterium]